MIKIANLEALIAKYGSYSFHMEVNISILGWIFSFRGIGYGLHSMDIKSIDSMVIFGAPCQDVFQP